MPHVTSVVTDISFSVTDIHTISFNSDLLQSLAGMYLRARSYLGMSRYSKKSENTRQLKAIISK